jgi:Glycosyltransferase Family 4
VNGALRVALLDHAFDDRTVRVGRTLAAAGHRPIVLTTGEPDHETQLEVKRLRRVPNAPLRARKIGDELAHLPAAWLALRRHDPAVANAFTPSDALAAIAWSRRKGRPAVFTCMEAPRRESLATRRLRLATWTRALEWSSAVLAVDEAVAAGLREWMAVEAPVVDLGDVDAHLRLYSRLLGRVAQV